MSEIPSLLSHAVSDLSEPNDALQETLRRARRRQRRTKITAVVVAIAVAVLGISAGTWTILRSTPRKATTIGSCENGWQTFAIKGPGNYFNRINGIDALSSSDIWAVGSYGQVPAAWLSPRLPGSSGPAPPVLETPWALHWDGQSWARVPTANLGVRLTNPPFGGSSLWDLSAASSNDVWMVGGGGGGSIIEHWDGHSLSIVRSPPQTNLVNGALVAVSADGPKDAWAVGSGGPGGIINPVIEHWDGSTWSSVPSPPVDPRYSVLEDVAAISPNDAWAVGRSWDQSLILHWDGESWKVVPSPQVRAPRLMGVAALAPDDVWAAGATYKDVNGEGPTYELLEHWDGTRWSLVPIPASRSTGFLGDISIAGASDIWLHAGPDYSKQSTKETLLHYDGRAWKTAPQLPAAVQLGAVSDIAAIPGGTVWLVGTYQSGRLSQPIVARNCATG
jgi:hypothetical protein